MDTYKAAIWLDDGYKRRGGGATGCGIFIPGPVTQKSLNLSITKHSAIFFNIGVFEEAITMCGNDDFLKSNSISHPHSVFCSF